AQTTLSESTAMFQERAQAYAALHRRLSENLQRDGVDSPEMLRAALQKAIRDERRHAKTGDLFRPVLAASLVQLVRTNMAARPLKDRVAIRSQVPRVLMLHVNDRYPSGEVFATIPPELLVRFPEIPPELQYRFLDRSLILLDEDADLIVDV